VPEIHAAILTPAIPQFSNEPPARTPLQPELSDWLHGLNPCSYEMKKRLNRKSKHRWGAIHIQGRQSNRHHLPT
jgi:hypothetical protein